MTLSQAGKEIHKKIDEMQYKLTNVGIFIVITKWINVLYVFQYNAVINNNFSEKKRE